MKSTHKAPLYRKVNTTARGVRHLHGGDYRDSRKKAGNESMRQGVQRGLDYTPLFRFLLSKVGSPWDSVHSEAVSRLDKEEPIYWLVAKNINSAKEYVLMGESTYYSGLYIDEVGYLRIVNPALNASSLKPNCKCCTHTFNGVVFTQKYQDPYESGT